MSATQRAAEDAIQALGNGQTVIVELSIADAKPFLDEIELYSPYSADGTYISTEIRADLIHIEIRP